tara:strand:+ start:180 stop:356 length:177 start_codon:yes stop_codon:yes gene_type:complete
MEQQAKQLKHNLYKLAWYMRGSLGVNEAFSLDNEDREIISNIIEENFETTKKIQMPHF